MKNQRLAEDYIVRAEKRIHALNALMKVESWADVVREAQEVVELALKALLRRSHIDVPRVHDVSSAIEGHKSQFASSVSSDLEFLCDISRELRRDRELAFYGSEDLTPSEFYKQKDAESALENAKKVVEIVKKAF